MEADQDKDGKISFDEFKKMVENTDVSMSMTLGKFTFVLICRPMHESSYIHRPHALLESAVCSARQWDTSAGPV
jgi:hypothetical protein